MQLAYQHPLYSENNIHYRDKSNGDLGNMQTGNFINCAVMQHVSQWIFFVL